MGRSTRWSILLTVVVAIAIAALTLTPPADTGMPAGSDKAYHALAFAALAVPLALVRPRWSAWLFGIFSAYGAAIELIQPYVGRSRELADLIADMIGIGCGMVVALLVRRLLCRRPDRKQRGSRAQRLQSDAWTGR